MFGIKKLLSETFFSCMNPPAKQVEPRTTPGYAIHAEDVWLPISSSNNPSLQVCKDTDRNNKGEELASFRHFIINKESGKPQQDEEAHQPEDEEFSFCSLLKQSDPIPATGFSFEPENIPSSKNNKEDKEEDTDYEDEEDMFECVQVQIDIADRQKQYIEESARFKDLKINQESSNQETKEEPFEDEFSLLQRDILQNGRIKFDGRSRSRCISMDESENQFIPKIIEDDEFSLLQKEISQNGRINFDGRRSTSRSISMDESVTSSSSSARSSCQQHRKKVTFKLDDCCSVSHRIRTADILFSKILRALRFRKRTLKLVGILKKSHIQRNDAQPTLRTFFELSI